MLGLLALVLALLVLFDFLVLFVLLRRLGRPLRRGAATTPALASMSEAAAAVTAGTGEPMTRSWAAEAGLASGLAAPSIGGSSAASAVAAAECCGSPAAERAVDAEAAVPSASFLRTAAAGFHPASSTGESTVSMPKEWRLLEAASWSQRMTFQALEPA
jgi:hypothetical protein